MRPRPLCVLLVIAATSCGSVASSGGASTSSPPSSAATAPSTLPAPTSAAPTSAAPTTAAPTSAMSTVSAPAVDAILRGDGLGAVRFGAPEAEIVAALEKVHGVPLRAVPPKNTATPWANGCTSGGDTMLGFPSGLLVGLTDGLFTSWTAASAKGAEGYLRTPTGLTWGDALARAKDQYRARYQSADLLPLYNWGSNIKVVATVEDSGSILLATFETDEFGWGTDRVWLMTAGLVCAGPPVVVPAADPPVGQRFTVAQESLGGAEYRLLDPATGTATPWRSLAGVGCNESACAFLRVVSDDNPDVPEAWVAQRVDRDRAQEAWLVTDRVRTDGSLLLRFGSCSMPDGGISAFAAIRVDARARPAAVVLVDVAVARFVERELGDLECLLGDGEGEPARLSGAESLPASPR